MAEVWTITQKVDLARSPVSYNSQPDTLMLPGDNQGHIWRVEVLKNRLPVDIEGATITGYFLRSDGNTVMVVGSASGNVATVTLAQECYAYSGGIRAVMRCVKDGAIMALADRAFVVRAAIDDGGIIDPGEVIPSIDDLLAQIDAMEAATAEANTAASTANTAATESESRTTAAIADMRGTVDGYLAEAADALIDVTERAGAPVIIAEAGPAKPLILTDGAIDAPVSRVALSIQPLQSGGGVPSPTNVRPITGWTGANITRCGKNLLDPAKYITSRVTVDGDSLVCKSTAYYSSIFSTQTAGRIDVPRLISIPAGTLTISCASIVSNTEDGSTTLYVYTCDAEGGNKITRGTLKNDTLALTFTMDEPGYLDVQMSSNNANLTITKFQLEVGNAATEYEAWNGARAASDWSATAGTVYGGTADLRDGTLVSECAVTTIGALTWTYYDDENGKYFRTRIYNIQGIPNKTGSDEYLASGAYRTVLPRTTNIIDMPDCSIKENRYNTSPYGQYIYLRDLRFTTEADLKAAMGDVQIVYRKATPETFAVDPVVLTTLKGFNAITADCGPIAVEYSADTQTYITAQATATTAALAGKVNINQGIDQAGKALVVGEDGAVTVGEIGIPDAVKVALLNLVQHVAYIDDQGQAYYNTLYAALYAGQFPRLSATYAPGEHVVYTDDSLNTLKPYLTVKVIESATDTGTIITDYTLSGVLVDGLNTVIVQKGTLATPVQVVAVDFYNQWEWTLSSGSLISDDKGWNSLSDRKLRYYKDSRESNYPRKAGYVNRGLVPLYNASDNEYYEDAYPVPVPQNATSVICSVTPATLKVGIQAFVCINGGYDAISSISGWQTGSATVTFEPGENHFMIIAISKDNAQFPAGEPSEIRVQFE